MKRATFLTPFVSPKLKGLRSYFTLLTPSIAKQLLAGAEDVPNRKVRKAHVEDYARCMQKGLWNERNGVPIILDKYGRLIDGQHRCEAVILSGVSIITLVVEGVEPEAIGTVDICQIRSAENCLNIFGIETEKHVVAIAKQKLVLDNHRRCGDDSGSNNKVSKPEQVEEVLNNVEYYNYVARTAKAIVDNANKAFTIAEAGGLIAYLNLTLGYEMEVIMRFFGLLCVAEYGTAYRNAWARFMEHKKKDAERTQIWISAWHAFLNDKKRLMKNCSWFE